VLGGLAGWGWGSRPSVKVGAGIAIGTPPESLVVVRTARSTRPAAEARPVWDAISPRTEPPVVRTAVALRVGDGRRWALGVALASLAALSVVVIELRWRRRRAETERSALDALARPPFGDGLSLKDTPFGFDTP